MSLIEPRIEPQVEPHTRRFTRDEYYAMADLGLFEGQRVELIEGEIFEMAPQKSPHFTSIDKAQECLRKTFGPGYWVRAQGPLHLDDGSEPEPDISLVRGTRDDYSDHPNHALLVIEVSETTLAYDRSRKARLYAQAGIADYWIVDLIHRRLEVRRNPQVNPAGIWSYAEPLLLSPGQSIAPLAAPNAPVAVADLLP